MIYFEYNTSVVDKVIEELQNAEEYIRIAMFQIHRSDVFELLEKKLKEGVKIEVFTLPYESIKIKNLHISTNSRQSGPKSDVLAAEFAKHPRITKDHSRRRTFPAHAPQPTRHGAELCRRQLGSAPYRRHPVRV